MEVSSSRVALLRIPVARAALGDSKSAFYDNIQRGIVTRPVKIGARAAALPSNEVDALVAARIAGQSDEQLKALVQRLHAARVAGAVQ